MGWIAEGIARCGLAQFRDRKEIAGLNLSHWSHGLALQHLQRAEFILFAFGLIIVGGIRPHDAGVKADDADPAR